MDEAALMSMASFPYMLSLVVDPFVKKREQCVAREVTRRGSYEHTSKRHYLFVTGYRELLDRMVGTHAAQFAKVAEAVSKMYIMERFTFYASAMRVLEEGETRPRTLIERDIRRWMGLLRGTMGLVLEECMSSTGNRGKACVGGNV